MLSDIMKVIEDRRSVQEYSAQTPPNNVLLKVLKAATWAPSAHNAQPWRFIVINDRQVKQMLASAMAREWERDLRKEELPPEERARLIESSIKRFTNSPVIIIPCLTMENMHKYPDKGRRKAEYIMAVQSVAAAIQNLLLAAHAEDLGTCWFCAPLFCPEKVKEVIRAPENIEPQALITLGYPDGKPKPSTRKPLKSVVHRNYWGCSW